LKADRIRSQFWLSNPRRNGLNLQLRPAGLENGQPFKSQKERFEPAWGASVSGAASLSNPRRNGLNTSLGGRIVLVTSAFKSQKERFEPSKLSAKAGNTVPSFKSQKERFELAQEASMSEDVKSFQIPEGTV